MSRWKAIALPVAVLSTITACGIVSATATGRTSWDGCTTKAGDIAFRAPDGTRLAGHRFGHGRTAVVLAHQSDGDLCQWRPYALRLAGLGYLAIAFDFRNVGDSQQRHYPANNRPGGDVAGAVREARRLGATKVFLVGASLGGSAVLQAASNVKPRVAGVVSVSGAADLSHAIESVPHLAVPVEYVAASGDRDFAADAKRLYAATHVTDRKLVLLDDSRHGTALVAGNAMARNAIESFLRAH
jgi:alpha-beta hydrolase superfamily lysophospholipase